MHCPYCGGLNSDRATFCVNCGRDLVRQLPNAPAQGQQPVQNPYSPSPARPRQGTLANPPAQQVYQPLPQRQPAPTSPPPQQPPTTSGRRQPAASPRAPAQPTASSRVVPADPMPVRPAAPDAPAPFPPRTMAQLEALLPSGIQQYTVVESRVEYGRRKIVRVAYPACANWQQVATLFKALQEQQEAKFETIIIQGVLPRQTDVYGFTNGQLQFDRDIRLGGQIGNRYMVETGNGFASDSVRFVLNR